jgi:hypothetical protein
MELYCDNTASLFLGLAFVFWLVPACVGLVVAVAIQTLKRWK